MLIQEYDLRNTPSIEASVRHSDVVYNLVGRDYPTKYDMKPLCPRLALSSDDAAGTFPWKTFTLREPSVSPKQLPNMMSTDSSKFHHTAPTCSRRPSSTAPK